MFHAALVPLFFYAGALFAWKETRCGGVTAPSGGRGSRWGYRGRPSEQRQRRGKVGRRWGCDFPVCARALLIILRGECFRFEWSKFTDRASLRWCFALTWRSAATLWVVGAIVALSWACRTLSDIFLSARYPNPPTCARPRPILGQYYFSGNSSQDSSSYATKISPPSPPLSMTARSTALTRTLMVTLSFLGISLLALEKQHGTSMNGTSANEENTDTVGDGAAKPNPEGKSGTVAGGPGSGQGSAVVAELVESAESADSAAAASPVTASAAQVGVGEVDEAIDVLKRALGMLRTEAAALAAASTAEVEAARAGVSSAVGIDRTEEVKEQTARVLDVLSEAYAHQRRWEQARCAAVQVGRRSRMH